MVRAAQAKGYGYIAITDHSRHATMAYGLDTARLARQIDEIDRINQKLSGFVVLKSIEVDILEDGRLDLPDDILQRLDIVVGHLLAAPSIGALEEHQQSTARLSHGRAPCDARTG